MKYSYLILAASLLFFSQISLAQFRKQPESQNRSIRTKVFGQNIINHSHDRQSIQQGICKTMEMDSIRRAKDPSIGTLEDFENRLQLEINNYNERLATGRIKQDVITIPVVVHVIHFGESVGDDSNISQAQVNSQIAAFNEHFRRTGDGFNTNPVGADIEIEFAPAIWDPAGNRMAEPGIDRVRGSQNSYSSNEVDDKVKPATIWDPNQYFNIWTVDFALEESGLLGYAQFPSLSGLEGMPAIGGGADTDGIVINYLYFGRTSNIPVPYHQGKTASHEVGHWLGNRHIWGDGGCLVDDFCTDTPNADGQRWSSVFLGCPTDDECGEGDRPVDNYMDYSDDPCRNTFTECQKTRMRTVMDTSPRRKELQNSTVHLEKEAPFARFSSNTTTGCEGQIVVFVDESTNAPSEWDWTFRNDNGDIVAESQLQNPVFSVDILGSYDVQLIASNSAGGDTLLQTNYLGIVSDSLFSRIDEDFEDTSNALNEWLKFNPDDDVTFEFANVSAFGNGTGSIFMNNFDKTTDIEGRVDALITPKLDFSTAENPYVLFDHAYAEFSEGFVDSLALFYSTDCAETFTQFWIKGGNELATATPKADSFVPSSNEWISNQVSLEAVKGFSEVHIAFVNISGWGNNLYLDNIIIENLIGTQPPQPVTIRVSDDTPCVGLSVQYDDITPEFPNSWTWTFEGGTPATSTLQNPIVTYTAPGSYDVTLRVGNGFGDNTETFTDYVTVQEKPTITITPDKTDICPGEEFTLTASGANQYFWYDGRSNQPFSEDSVVSDFIIQEQFYYLLGLTNSGCVDTTSYFVELLPEANVSITASATEVCPGDTVDFSGSGAETYYWVLKNDTIANVEAIRVSITETSSVGLIGTVSAGCPGFDIADVEVKQAPAAEITVMDSVLTATEGDSYQWYLQNIPIEGATSQEYVANQSGKYNVEVFNDIGCSNLSEAVIIGEPPLIIYNVLSPNGDGINDFLFIDNIQAYASNKVSIFNRNGSVVWEITGYSNEDPNLRFEGVGNKGGYNDLPDGTYYYVIDRGNGSDSGFFLIQR